MKDGHHVSIIFYRWPLAPHCGRFAPHQRPLAAAICILLNLLNDYKGMVLFATNFLRNYDPAFLRRIRYHIHFPLPDAEHREMLWKQYIPARMPCRVDYRELAEKYDGISGSDIANAVFTAAVFAAGNHEKEVSQIALERAIQSAINAKSANQSYRLGKYTEAIKEHEQME